VAVCRLAPGGEIPEWAFSGGGFASVTRTADELSLVCAESAVPDGIQCEPGWRIFKIEGPLDFALTGIFYVMVKEQDLEKAVRALEAAGHWVKR
jgi:hypothetical protein